MLAGRAREQEAEVVGQWRERARRAGVMELWYCVARVMRGELGGRVLVWRLRVKEELARCCNAQRVRGMRAPGARTEEGGVDWTLLTEI